MTKHFVILCLFFSINTLLSMHPPHSEASPCTSKKGFHTRLRPRQSKQELGISLLIAAQSGNTRGIIYLLNQGAPVNVVGEKRNQGLTALAIAANLGNVQMVEKLLAHGADPNIQIRWKYWKRAQNADPDVCHPTALISACANPYADENKVIQIVQLLLDHGADCGGFCCDVFGRFRQVRHMTARDYAVMNDFGRVVTLIDTYQYKKKVSK